MERCPNCRARCDGSPQCRRCGMELGLLMHIERAAEAQLALAAQRLGAGEIPAAVEALKQSRRLAHSTLADQLLGFICRQGLGLTYPLSPRFLNRE